MNETGTAGIIIVTHGDLGRQLLVSAERIMGQQDFVRVITLQAEEGLDTITGNIEKAIKDEKMPEKKVIAVDIFGGTPSNASLFFLEKHGIEIVGGVNLPMLIAFFSERNTMPIEALIKKMLESGKNGVVNIKEIAVERLKGKR